MTKILTLAILSLFFIIDFPFKVLAETVLERIERTGEINAGARKNAVPFGYENSQGQWTGYSVEFLKIIHRRLEQKLNKPIKLNLQEVTIDNRFKMVQNGRVDLVCDATSITQQRLDLVDFSVPFFMAGTQFLIDKQDINNIDIGGTLAKVPVAYIPNTTTDRLSWSILSAIHDRPPRRKQLISGINESTNFCSKEPIDCSAGVQTSYCWGEENTAYKAIKFFLPNTRSDSAPIDNNPPVR
ncbi:MAG: transporter substrate-binding domain-containing protein [Hydrococcus sp. CSU_1_8]|nr:transporter substrate-binding domain-containing protein [Hydrococcus sp. CSU_1_8]